SPPTSICISRSPSAAAPQPFCPGWVSRSRRPSGRCRHLTLVGSPPRSGREVRSTPLSPPSGSRSSRPLPPPWTPERPGTAEEGDEALGPHLVGGTGDTNALRRGHSVTSGRDEGRSWVWGTGSAVHAGATAAGELDHLGLGDHRGVTRGGHRQRTVRGAVLHRGGQRLTGEQTEDQAGGEGVAAAHPVQDLQVLAVGGLGEALVLAPRDGAPVVVRGGVHGAQR